MAPLHLSFGVEMGILVKPDYNSYEFSGLDPNFDRRSDEAREARRREIYQGLASCHASAGILVWVVEERRDHTVLEQRVQDRIVVEQREITSGEEEDYDCWKIKRDTSIDEEEDRELCMLTPSGYLSALFILISLPGTISLEGAGHFLYISLLNTLANSRTLSWRRNHLGSTRY